MSLNLNKQSELKQKSQIQDIWQEISLIIKNGLSAPAYEMFNSSITLQSYQDGVLTIKVNNRFLKDWFQDRCEQIVKQSLYDKYQIALPILYKIEEELESNTEKEIKNKELENKQAVIKLSQDNNSYNSTINHKYNFDTFVVGDCNRFVHAASIAVASAPSKAYNPLFIYGGVGLGKTHLLHAIANKIISEKPGLKILYVTSEAFTNDLINSLRDQKIPEFRNKYRLGIDLLLVDDIQFIAGKEKTEEEFFHTFNALHSNNKQIVLTSDRSPKELKTLGERLRSRFEWGLMADIQPPELETRIAIMRKKAEEESLEVPDEVLEFIATQIPSNVRELEGALTRIVAYSSLVHKKLSVPFAQNVIKDMVSFKKDKVVTINVIKKVVSEYFKISIEDLSIRKRTKEIAEARQFAMYLSRTLTTASLPKIGEEFGGRDHATVIHAYDKIKSLVDKNPTYKKMVAEIQEMM